MENLWIVFALISAFSLATSDALTKKALSIHNEYLIAWLRLLLSLPLLLTALMFVPVPSLDDKFYKAFIFALPLEIAAIILYIKALKVSPLSLSLPFLSLSPVFLIIISYLMLGEKVSLAGGAGIMLIASGGYMLNIREFKKGIFEPFGAIKREKGSVFMIIVALIYSVTSSLGKMAIEHSSAVFFGAAYIAVLFLFLTPIALYKGRSELSMIFRSGAFRASILPGVFSSIMILTNMIALSLTKVAYMISVKRLSLLIGVLYGYIFFREAGIRERLTGTLLMLSGFLLIVLLK